jgi:hypothetical protein
MDQSDVVVEERKRESPGETAFCSSSSVFTPWTATVARDCIDPERSSAKPRRFLRSVSEEERCGLFERTAPPSCNEIGLIFRHEILGFLGYFVRRVSQRGSPGEPVFKPLLA